ncbi:MAG: hypothetical protein V7K40_21395 [Nostoc sp.]|uniref:hypothetical protein n=1 Tax=Nostoc sp. TaxID=1180 RepID=UPI002FF5530F
MENAGKLVTVSAKKINGFRKPAIIPVPTLAPNPNISSISTVVNESLVKSIALAKSSLKEYITKAKGILIIEPTRILVHTTLPTS